MPSLAQAIATRFAPPAESSTPPPPLSLSWAPPKAAVAAPPSTSSGEEKATPSTAGGGAQVVEDAQAKENVTAEDEDRPQSPPEEDERDELEEEEAPTAPPSPPPLSGSAQGETTSIEVFQREVDTYLDGLHEHKRAKALIDADCYAMIKAILLNPKDTTNGTAQERFWAKSRFAFLSTPEGDVLTCEKRIVVVKDQLYETLKAAHIETGHAGRDKTFARVKAKYSYVPKELAAGFVKHCPACTPKKVNFRGRGPSQKKRPLSPSPNQTPKDKEAAPAAKRKRQKSPEAS
ncbi:hypothetical protein JCM10213_005251 [Rhodosporidiobolus nylandii]